MHTDSPDYEDPLSSAVLEKGPCPKCGSDDNLVTYQDGHKHCFTPGCGYHVKSETDTSMPATTPKAPASQTTVEVEGSLMEREAMTPLPLTRGLKPETLKKFQYMGAYIGKDPCHVWPIFDQAGNLAHQRVRFTNKKDFVVLKQPNTIGVNECWPFGKQVWGDQNDRRVVVTEGEIDAMSVAQCGSFKFPCVSPNGGSNSMAKMLKANYKWFDRFEEIILWPDDDDAGREHLDECVNLFAVGKVKIAKIAGYKDANEALVDKKYAEIEQAIYAAVLWVPKGIVNAADCLSDMEDEEETPFWQYPFPGLQTMTGGMRRAETSYWVAGTGIGKTTALQETLVHIVTKPELSTEVQAHVGYMGFEDLRKVVQLDLMSIVARQRLKINPLPKAKRVALHKQLFGSRNFDLFDVENAQWTFKAIISYVRYMVKALGCNVIVLDPLTFLAAMLEAHVNQVTALDQVSQQLAALSKELNCHIAVTHHLTRPQEGPGHEEGGTISLRQVRGSGGIANFAALVVGAERNQQAENDKAKTITRWRILKNRWLSVTGIACYTQYDLETGRTYEIPAAEAMKLLGTASASTGGSSASGFTNDDDEDTIAGDF